MSEHVRQLRVLHNLFIVDANGNGLVDAIPGLKSANYRDRPYFIFHRTHSSRSTHIGRTVRSRTDGSWIITVTRRLNHPDGSFAGVAMATISGQYFSTSYDRVDIGRSGVITLALADGTVLMRKPFERSSIERASRKHPFLARTSVSCRRETMRTAPSSTVSRGSTHFTGSASTRY